MANGKVGAPLGNKNAKGGKKGFELACMQGSIFARQWVKIDRELSQLFRNMEIVVAKNKFCQTLLSEKPLT
jgi:hypothetical protein